MEEQEGQEEINSDLDNRTLMDSCHDRQKAIMDMRKVLLEHGTYFSARTNETLWRGLKQAETELSILLEQIESVNEMMMGR